MAQRSLVKALVLQGGGALGAFELGVARHLYRQHAYRPDVIAGVSIGAITAVLLARPRGGDPLEALEGFWRKVGIDVHLWPAQLRPYASMWGNPAFFLPNADIWNMAGWTSLYSTEPLRRTLSEFVDEAALADPEAAPRLVMAAVDLAQGRIVPFWSDGQARLTLDHVLASGSLPPSFPATRIDGHSYWDGGLFDNTPLGMVIERMKPPDGGAAEREIVVVNLFPNAGEIPTNLAEVAQRMLALTFANKTASDLRLLDRFNAVAGLLHEIRTNPDWAGLRATDAFRHADRDYIQVPRIVPITRSEALTGAAWTDFSTDAIDRLAEAGFQAAAKAFAAPEAAKADAKAMRLSVAQ